MSIFIKRSTTMSQKSNRLEELMKMRTNFDTLFTTNEVRLDFANQFAREFKLNEAETKILTGGYHDQEAI
jgi:hypothetical protein